MIIVLMEYFYAKFFKSITLSVIGDNYNICNGFISAYKARLTSMTNPVNSILVCPDLASCPHRNSSPHKLQYSHPPQCADNHCTVEGTHSNFTCHVEFCKDAHNCHLINDSEHFDLFKHLPRCQNFRCTDESRDHRQKFWHLKRCPQGLSCANIHSCPFDHTKTKCSDRNCNDLRKIHRDQFEHPKSISRDPFYYEGTMTNDLLVCQLGTSCTADHKDRFLHFDRPQCSDGKQCKDYSDEHHFLFAHPFPPSNSFTLLRPECRKSNCIEKSNHLHSFSHSHSEFYSNKLVGNMNPKFPAEISVDFTQNIENLKRLLDFPAQITGNIKEIAELVTTLRPVHRISPDNFSSSMKHGCLYSLGYMKSDLGDVTKIAAQARSHFRLQEYNNPKEAAQLLEIYVKQLYDESRSSDYEQEFKNIDFQVGSKVSSEEKANLITLARSIIEAAKQLYNAANNVADSPSDSSAPGIGYEKDKLLGTHNTIFAIMGANTNQNYGPISVVLKKGIARHPASWLHLGAATYYLSCDFRRGREYVTGPKNDDETIQTEERKKFYYSLIQNLGVEGTDLLLAYDLARFVGNKMKKNPMSVTAENVIQHLEELESHDTIEVHLPSRISFSEVSNVLMPTDIFNNLDSETKRRLEFLNDQNPGFLVKVDHAVNHAGYKQSQWDLCLKPDLELGTNCGFNFVLVEPSQESVILPQAVTTDQDVHLSFALKFSHGTALMFKFYQDSTEVGQIEIVFGLHEVSVSYEGNGIHKHTKTPQKLYSATLIKRIFSYFGISFLKSGKVVIKPIGRERCFEFDHFEFHCNVLKNSHNSMKLRVTQQQKDSFTVFKDFKIGLSSEAVVEPLDHKTVVPARVADDSTFIPPTCRKTSRVDTSMASEPTSTTPQVSSIPVCKDPFTCRYHFDGRHIYRPETLDHCSKFRHVCRFGFKCTNKDSTHLSQFIHLELPNCPEGYSCSQLSDKIHRCSYNHEINHPNFKYLPYLCSRPGPGCRNIEHAYKFAHWDNDSDVDVIHLIKYQSHVTVSQPPVIKSQPFSTCQTPIPRNNSQKQFSAPKVKTNEVDLNLYASFCFDATGSMSRYIRQTADNIVNMSRNLNEQMVVKIRRTGLDQSSATSNFAFVAYRDIGDKPPVESIPFSPVDELATKIATIRSFGGRGDGPEDAATGLDTVRELEWGNGHRLVFIVADEPPHGRRFVPRGSDDFPTVDQNGIPWDKRWEPILQWARQFDITFLICPVGNNNKRLEPFREYLASILGSDKVIGLDMSGNWMDTLQHVTASSYEQYLRNLQK
ncbi:hypothetical protein RCL1_005361 [Eukaryota sp. TZLM3-RCL]